MRFFGQNVTLCCHVFQEKEVCSNFLLPSRFDGLKKTLGFFSNDRIKFDSKHVKQLCQRHKLIPF